MSSTPVYVTDAYGTEAKSLLQPLQDEFASLAEKVTEYFYNYILTQEKVAAVIDRLRPEAFKRLKEHVTLYLCVLLSDELTQSEHVSEAQKIGRTHALEGIEIHWLMEAYSLYQDEILKLLKECVPDSATRELLMGVIAQRFLQDLEVQFTSYQQLATDISHAFSRAGHLVMSAESSKDLVHGALQTIGTLPGGVSVFFARMDDAGIMQIEQSYGDAAERYHSAMEAGITPKISVDPSIPEGQGPGGRAWRSGEIIISDAWIIETDKEPWQSTGDDLGFRSSAAVPILDELGHSIALLSLYSGWPGYFSNESIRVFLGYIQQLLNREIRLRVHLPVVPLREQQVYCSLLSENRIVMRYQPVIDLYDGSLVKFEGLAHLQNDDGFLIAPRRFLHALGQSERLKLFELGMAQICSDLHTLLSQKLDTMIAINLPSEGLDDPRYEQIFFDWLGSSGLTPDRFQVEVLENQDAGEKNVRHKAFIERLQVAGVQVAQDGLGSGDSSLLRLGQYPFDEAKIAPRLFKNAMHNPKQALDFILHVTRFSHSFDTPLTIVGLENEGMLEASAILGADCGQGYAIAKPMPVDQLPVWLRDFTYSINPRKPRTALGILACYMLWDIQLAAISKQSRPTAEFVEEKMVIVEQFIIANNLKGSSLAKSLRSCLGLTASSRRRSETALTMWAQLIKGITEFSLNEAICYSSGKPDLVDV